MAAAPGPHDPAAPDANAEPGAERAPAGPDPGGPQQDPGSAQQPVRVDVSGLPAAADGGCDDVLGGLGAIAALARLRLAARRTGHRVRLRGASRDLRELVELAGLAGEFEWEAEEREEPGGVEE